MITENFKEIKDMGENIKKLVYKQYQKRELTLLTLKKEEREITQEDIKKIKSIPQISPFFDNI
ncbi:MAG: hypothetical protein ISS82_05775 [Nanoarchaeota archaeon]|nr:hypothetical protein [Nanoarchaeota archaeon]